MLTIITFFIAIAGSLVSFAAILVQFIGTETSLLEALALYQLGFAVFAALFILPVTIELFIKAASIRNFFKFVFIIMPGWLMFGLLLLLTTALLGDLSIYLVRLTGRELSWIYHIPSLCILGYCLVFRLLHLKQASLKSSALLKGGYIETL